MGIGCGHITVIQVKGIFLPSALKTKYSSVKKNSGAWDCTLERSTFKQTQFNTEVFSHKESAPE